MRSQHPSAKTNSFLQREISRMRYMALDLETSLSDGPSSGLRSVSQTPTATIQNLREEIDQDIQSIQRDLNQMYRIDQKIAVPVENGVKIIKRSIDRINRSFESSTQASPSNGRSNRSYIEPTSRHEEESETLKDVMNQLSRIRRENESLRQQIQDATEEQEYASQYIAHRERGQQFSFGDGIPGARVAQTVRASDHKRFQFNDPVTTRSSASANTRPRRKAKRCEECLTLLSKGFSTSKCSEHGHCL